MVWLLELPSRMLGKVVPTRMPSIGCFKLPMVCIAHGIAQQDHLQCVAHQNVQLKVAHQNASAAASEDDPGLDVSVAHCGDVVVAIQEIQGQTLTVDASLDISNTSIPQAAGFYNDSADNKDSEVYMSVLSTNV